MKHRAIFTGAILLSALAAPAAATPITITITVDEYGNGIRSDKTADPYLFITPGPYNVNKPLTYILPFLVTNFGQIHLCEVADKCTNKQSDFIAFEAFPGDPRFSLLKFWSDNNDGHEVGVLADTGLPENWNNQLDVTEVELPNFGNGIKGFSWNPQATGLKQYGYANGYDITYNFFSDGRVPEPLTISIFGAGLVGAIAMRRRRKAGKTA